MGAHVSHGYAIETGPSSMTILLFVGVGPNKLPWHFHHLRQAEGAVKKEMRACIATCAHLVLPGTSKRLANNLVSKRLQQHSKTHSDFSFRPKRSASDMLDCHCPGTSIPSSIVSPSTLGLKRDFTERKDSATDDNRSNTTGSTRAPSNSASKALPSKSSFMPNDIPSLQSHLCLCVCRGQEGDHHLGTYRRRAVERLHDHRYRLEISDYPSIAPNDLRRGAFGRRDPS